MAIAITLENFLKEKNVNYDVITHENTRYSMETAECAHIPGDLLAKCIMLEDAKGKVMATIPATRRLALDDLNYQLNRRLHLSRENELQQVFQDCEPGSVPAIGGAYGLETVIDEHLWPCKDIYFEAGSHTEVIHLSGKDFFDIQRRSKHGFFSRHI